MRNRFEMTFLLIAIMLLLFCAAAPADEEPGAIILGDTVISPGQKIVFVVSNIGFPEQIYAMRGKKDASGDYIKFDYVDYGLTFNISSGENLIKSIYVKKNDVKLKGIPFRVGDSYDQVKKAWGEPDKKESGYANYFYRGVTLKINDDGYVDLIAIYKPGKIDYDEMKKKKAPEST